ncbi:MAG: secretion protein HlyD, partial [Clostridia bacterium]|nr:secretion protein HlyD [Clostridia bacterium]
NGLVEGVYVKNNNVINFKEITRIYTDEDYILCKATTDITGTEEEESQYRPLSQFDEVIVEGTDLYDGKFI